MKRSDEFAKQLHAGDVRTQIDSYDPTLPLEQASTIPATWYTDKRVFALEQATVWSSSWHVAARVDQLTNAGDYGTTQIAGEPIVIVRGSDDQIRGFFNACRHHAAAVMTEPAGNAPQLRCPYHGWTYSLEGELKGTPDFNDVCNFDRSANGLAPVETAVWEKWLFVKLGGGKVRHLNSSKSEADSNRELTDFLGHDLIHQ